MVLSHLNLILAMLDGMIIESLQQVQDLGSNINGFDVFAANHN